MAALFVFTRGGIVTGMRVLVARHLIHHFFKLLNGVIELLVGPVPRHDQEPGLGKLAKSTISYVAMPLTARLDSNPFLGFVDARTLGIDRMIRIPGNGASARGPCRRLS